MAIFPLEKATEGARREREDETLSGPVVELVAVRSPPRRDTGRPILHPTAGHAGVRSRGQALADGYQCASESDRCAVENSCGVGGRGRPGRRRAVAGEATRGHATPAST